MNKKLVLWAYFQTGKIVAALVFAPVLLWIIPSSHSQPWTYYWSTGSWGTAVSPYGLLWYGFYRVLSSFSDNWNTAYTIMNVDLCIIDTLVFIVILRHSTSLKLSWAFYLSSFFLLYFSPSDLLPFWLGALAVVKWPNMLLALAAKLPLGAPLWVWAYIWQISLGTHNFTQTGGDFPFFNVIRDPIVGLWMISPIVRLGMVRFANWSWIRSARRL